MREDKKVNGQQKEWRSISTDEVAYTEWGFRGGGHSDCGIMGYDTIQFGIRITFRKNLLVPFSRYRVSSLSKDADYVYKVSQPTILISHSRTRAF